MTQPLSDPPVYVWDPFVRVFHWSLVACVFLNFLVEEGEAPHQWIGYAASALVAARIVWGFVGSRYARFSDFFPTPTRLRQHLAALLAGLALAGVIQLVGIGGPTAAGVLAAVVPWTLALLVVLSRGVWDGVVELVRAFWPAGSDSRGSSRGTRRAG